MMNIENGLCPSCRQPMPALTDQIENMVMLLREHCRELSIPIDFTEAVCERDAALLAGVAPDTLRKSSSAGYSSIEFTRRGRRRFYSLKNIAQHLVGVR